MSLQALWILSSNTDVKNATILFSRFFSTFIQRAKQIDGDQYVAIPSNPAFIKALLFELDQKTDGVTKFVESRDSCCRIDQKPVYEVNTSGGKLWPLVVVEMHGLLLCCLPFVPQGSHANPPLIDIQGVTLGFTLLCALGDFLRTTSKSEVSQRTSEIYAFLTQAAPFGTILDTTIDSVITKMLNKPVATLKTQKQPAWKPASHKGKNHIYLSITEYVRAVQYDKVNVDDVMDVYGTISCKAELDGTMPTVTMVISQATEGETTPLDHLLIHPCVQSADAYTVDESRDRAVPRRVRFTPPLEKIALCHYTVYRMNKLPITGSFEMFVEEKKVKVNVRLKLNEGVKNAFEFCELQVPFINRGTLTILDSSLNHGTLLLAPDKNVLVWNIGQRFPVKATEINMSAVLLLDTSVVGASGSVEEQFCVDQNGYAQIFFKIADYTHSRCFIDAKSIQVSPSMKYKLTAVRDFLTMEYKLWNVHGDSPVSAIPTALYREDVVDSDTG